ncbi:TonB-dependent receptor [Polaribacter pacificus]|uniref:TonB-dependent receptor n=2 Tax=Polaribacter pacificus TaxID=1775173 RepID=A0A917MF40_9FLAO|nr:TonB-dependent receptor [Polaribacter pacificus]
MLAQGQKPLDQAKTIKITGKIIDAATKEPLEYGTVVLKDVKTQKISGGISDSSGDFSITAPSGTYDISIEFISFKTVTYKNRVVDKDLNLGTIALVEDGQMLEEVNIMPEKSTVDIRLDKKIYNVGKDLTVKGGNVSDVLDNIPSVSVDVEGNVSLRGNENVRILIDGKPSALVGLDGASALRQLPADAIERVELITSPSARYDAEGTAGILNIILRKGKVTGFNGSINPKIGNPEQYGISANLNYRTKKFNIFNNTGYNYRNGPGSSFNDVTYFDANGNTTGYLKEVRESNRLNKGFNTSFGVEYYLTDNSSILANIVYRKSSNESFSSNNVDIFDINRTVTSNRLRIENENQDSNTIQYSLNYTNKFNTIGHQLSVDFQYSKSNQDEFGNIFQNSAFVEDNITVDESTKKLVQVDYVYPFGEGSQLEFGFKGDLEKSNTDYKNLPNVPATYDPSNNLIFEQNVYALYGQYGRKFEKFSFLVGVRNEISDIKINLLTTNVNYEKNYSKFFPTVNFGYELNDSESFTLGVSKRLRRPRSRFLNPFESRSSETNIFKGNVDLNPTYTTSYDFGYLKKWENMTLNSSVYFNHSTDIFQFVTQERGDFVNGVPVLLRTPINLAQEDRYGFELTANYTLSKKVNFSGSFNYFGFKTEGIFEYTNSNNQVITQDFGAQNTSWFTRLNAKVTLPSDIQWQTRFQYNGPQEGAQSKSKGMFSTNLAFSKDLMKDNGTLVLNISDLFNSRKRQSTSYTPNSETYGEYQWRQRQITLSFTYRFNQQNSSQKKDRAPQQQEDDFGGGEGFGK